MYERDRGVLSTYYLSSTLLNYFQVLYYFNPFPGNYMEQDAVVTKIEVF